MCPFLILAPFISLSAPPTSKYDHLTAIVGKTLMAKLKSHNVFLVGAGALGCEFLKNFAMMGMTCGDGLVTVTDMDFIETSNLNRQFLFRSENVGQAKSLTAANAAQAMNPDLKVVASEVPVGPDTEETFDDAFWNKQNLITNALDNLKARLYVDGRCVFYRKPLMESGTLGTKANTQVRLSSVLLSTYCPLTPLFSHKNMGLRKFSKACCQWQLCIRLLGG